MSKTRKKYEIKNSSLIEFIPYTYMLLPFVIFFLSVYKNEIYSLVSTKTKTRVDCFFNSGSSFLHWKEAKKCFPVNIVKPNWKTFFVQKFFPLDTSWTSFPPTPQTCFVIWNVSLFSCCCCCNCNCLLPRIEFTTLKNLASKAHDDHNEKLKKKTIWKPPFDKLVASIMLWRVKVWNHF